MSHVGRQKELARTFLDEERTKLGVTRAPQVCEVNVMMTIKPDGDEASFVANKERRRTVTQSFVDLWQRQAVRAYRGH